MKYNRDKKHEQHIWVDWNRTNKKDRIEPNTIESNNKIAWIEQIG